MKFYQAEMEAIEYRKGEHTLKEWAGWGFNKVIYKDQAYYDGYLDGDSQNKWGDEQDRILKCDYWGYDEDGYMYVVLEDVQ